MKTYDIVLNKLEDDVNFRERRNKWNGIAEILKDKYREINADVLVEAESMARYWRMILQTNEHLRGFDYYTKKETEQRHKMSLGYEVGYKQDIKKQNTLI